MFLSAKIWLELIAKTKNERLLIQKANMLFEEIVENWLKITQNKLILKK